MSIYKCVYPKVSVCVCICTDIHVSITHPDCWVLLVVVVVLTWQNNKTQVCEYTYIRIHINEYTKDMYVCGCKYICTWYLSCICVSSVHIYKYTHPQGEICRVSWKHRAYFYSNRWCLFITLKSNYIITRKQSSFTPNSPS